ncbi:hypothetical protein [Pantoea agglomerans]|uniref:hypothetical protein n=1 Tax=Enterobacter agglomerans TaxID=549 RepID=UPI002412F3D9|nr:hypothetical protein [Pantoea agglomerans]
MEKLNELKEAFYPQYGTPGSRDMDVTARRKVIDENIEAVAEAFRALEQRAEAAEKALAEQGEQVDKANALIDDLREERKLLQRLAGDRGNKLESAEAKLAELAKRPPVGDFYEDGPGNWWQIGPHDKVPHVTPLFTRPAPAVGLAELVPGNDLLRVLDFAKFVIKCVRKNGEYAPLSSQEPDEIDAILRNIEGAHQNRQQNIPEIIPGWKLVPVEPTEEMIAAGDQFMDGLSRLGDAYDAMLAAAPEA